MRVLGFFLAILFLSSCATLNCNWFGSVEGCKKKADAAYHARKMDKAFEYYNKTCEAGEVESCDLVKEYKHLLKQEQLMKENCSAKNELYACSALAFLYRLKGDMIAEEYYSNKSCVLGNDEACINNTKLHLFVKDKADRRRAIRQGLQRLAADNRHQREMEAQRKRNMFPPVPEKVTTKCVSKKDPYSYEGEIITECR